MWLCAGNSGCSSNCSKNPCIISKKGASYIVRYYINNGKIMDMNYKMCSTGLELLKSGKLPKFTKSALLAYQV